MTNINSCGDSAMIIGITVFWIFIIFGAIFGKKVDDR